MPPRLDLNPHRLGLDLHLRFCFCVLTSRLFVLLIYAKIFHLALDTSLTNDCIIPLYKIYTDDDDVDLITKIVKRGTNWAMGAEIEEFENAIKDYVGVDYCLTLNSGTSALHAALIAYNISENDEVIVPSFSFISTANSVLFNNKFEKLKNLPGLQSKQLLLRNLKPYVLK